jgi:hypothetical protein
MLSTFYQLLFLALFFIPAILFLLTQQSTIKLIQPQNRSLSPGEVFLQLVPLFGMVWQFFVVIRLSDSIRRELGERTFSFEDSPIVYSAKDSRPTFKIGIIYCTLFCCYILPFVGEFLFMAGTVCWIVYWVRLYQYKKKLEDKRYLVDVPSSSK